jgi:hypothetical protein
MRGEGRAITDEPAMAQRIHEPTLPVPAPGHLVVTDRIDRAIGPGFNRSGHESVRVVDEDVHQSLGHY